MGTRISTDEARYRVPNLCCLWHRFNWCHRHRVLLTLRVNRHSMFCVPAVGLDGECCRAHGRQHSSSIWRIESSANYGSAALAGWTYWLTNLSSDDRFFAVESAAGIILKYTSLQVRVSYFTKISINFNKMVVIYWHLFAFFKVEIENKLSSSCSTAFL